MTNSPRPERLTLKKLKSEINDIRDEINQLKTKEPKQPKRRIPFALITAIAAFSVAVATWENLRMQGDYYQKTVRPFLYVSSYRFTFSGSDKNPKDDDSVTIAYKIKNVGALPAKGVKSSTAFFDHENRDYRPAYETSEATFSIFPDEERESFCGFGSISIGELKKRPYIHTWIRYFDAGDKEHYFKRVSLLKNIPVTKLSDRPIVWTDFD